MMRVLVLGGDGMLGHQLTRTLQQRHAVAVTIRGQAQNYRVLSGLADVECFAGIDARSPDALQRAIARFGPDAIVNCIGIVKQQELADMTEAIEINALLPHRLAQLCRASGARLVHISTDCVFSGRKGMYVESDFADAEDWYGRTKLLGEVTDAPCLTLRTSMIGRELRHKRGLMEWFLAQKGTVRGYRRAVFSGLTTAALSRAVETILTDYPNLNGLYHISSEPIDKYTLLQLLRDRFHRDIEIKADDRVVIDRSLDSTRLRREIRYAAPSWPEMVSEL
jgi:dTDP-4-dehydrorhamnose reductase